ncbi:hypothetical protein PT974_10064 [Cladobotryum mycophilum]|uniref:Uncharacterized protein n=1 Tax=Cladobotryum mycophilum TaxID=491253 RepID=A0ABR0S9X6_9HYPO
MAERIGGASSPGTANFSNQGSGSNSRSSADSSSPPSRCICRERSPDAAPPVESGPRSVYRNICHSDDPPRSVDALTGQDLSRWFPLTSPSDFLYFLPPRRGIDTARKLRLISSAGGLGSLLDPTTNMLHGFNNTRLMGLERLTAMAYLNPAPWHLTAGVDGDMVTPSQAHEGPPQEEFLSQNVPPDSPLRRISAASADHFRAIPLSDGYHILFTDPNRGNLCLGTDAPVGSLTRLLGKASFRPPANAVSPMPLLYAAGADTRHGVRVVATFAVGDGSSLGRHADRDPCLPVIDVSASKTRSNNNNNNNNKQLIMFYTVPPDVFHDMTRASSTTSRSFGDYGSGEREHWLPDQSYYGPMDVFSATHVSELGLDSSPDLIIWALSAEGWAKTWAIDTGRHDQWTMTSVQPDGSIRRFSQVDADGGDVAMSDSPPLDMSRPEMSRPDLDLFDGAATGGLAETYLYSGNAEAEAETAEGEADVHRVLVHEVQLQNRVENTVSIDIVEETSGITRVEIDVG